MIKLPAFGRLNFACTNHRDMLHLSKVLDKAQGAPATLRNMVNTCVGLLADGKSCHALLNAAALRIHKSTFLSRVVAEAFPS